MVRFLGMHSDQAKLTDGRRGYRLGPGETTRKNVKLVSATKTKAVIEVDGLVDRHGWWLLFATLSRLWFCQDSNPVCHCSETHS